MGDFNTNSQIIQDNKTVTTSEIGTGISVTTEWQIKNWEADFDFLQFAAQCPLIIPPNNGNPSVHLKFFFQGYRHSVGNQYETWLALKHDVTSETQAPFLLRTNVSKTDFAAEINKNYVISKCPNTYTLCERFIHASTEKPNIYGQKIPEKCIQRKELQLTITATVCHVNETRTEEGEIQGAFGVTNITEKSSLAFDVKAMYGAAENFSDVKLETKDDMTLSAHRFVLAARSPVFRKMMEKESEKPEYDGSLKMAVNAKPLIAVFHWMYTEELHENTGKVVEELVEFCHEFEILGLLKVLDDNMAMFCTTENMFRMFELAKKRGMKKATEAISIFIKRAI